MKNEKMNSGRQQDQKDAGHTRPQQDGTTEASSGARMNTQPSAAEKSNISVDNEGRIGKAHQWNPGQEKPQAKPDMNKPAHEPEKTEKKIPADASHKNSK